MHKSSRIRRGYTSCRFGHLHYRSCGSAAPDRTPVVLLHQNPSSSYEYEALIEALGRDRLVYAFDTPGYGMSDAPPAPPGMAGYAQAFSDGLDALAESGELTGKVDLYGFHTGTLLACELALARPDRVRSVALTGIPMFDEATLADKLAYAETFPTPDEDGTVIIDLLSNLWKYVVGARDPRVPLEKAVFNFADKANALDRFTWAYKGVWSYDYARLEMVEQPAFLLQPAEQIREPSLRAAARMQRCTVTEMPDLDRDIFDIAPERIANELCNFFDQHGPSDR
ncbi:alpha/beta fold hydrolase [Novosphingobium mangrovi (ex Hu et al. 2023)]|uniref:Alpha/beta hydrolase n=1 Tax=Novosphingobium mangrovi (ex Hu et al. 2023) TaxID=2930094 RepID=A0ABT0AFD5_9SPHN|nr:alpha/beta fold hydrolase [Novosphingobium mangrovi (ex Hu et al. 2023)]MCJ1961898.1 alpha/beta hydrolase [Novosphingobium mangrovi (ex Hu et al. 2023)]